MDLWDVSVFERDMVLVTYILVRFRPPFVRILGVKSDSLEQGISAQSRFYGAGYCAVSADLSCCETACFAVACD